MRYLWLFLLFPLYGFTRIHSTYEKPEYITDEFANVENDLQPKAFSIYQSTPNLVDFKDGEIVIVSSGTYNKLMFRSGQDLFAVSFSCITVKR